MKWFILVLLFYSCTAQAEESAKSTICKLIEENAALIMGNRQLGVSMAAQYEPIEQADEQSIMLKIIEDAYEQPRFSTEEHRTRVITEFRNKYFLLCIQGRLLVLPECDG